MSARNIRNYYRTTSKLFDNYRSDVHHPDVVVLFDYRSSKYPMYVRIDVIHSSSWTLVLVRVAKGFPEDPTTMANERPWRLVWNLDQLELTLWCWPNSHLISLQSPAGDGAPFHPCYTGLHPFVTLWCEKKIRGCHAKPTKSHKSAKRVIKVHHFEQ